MTTRVYGVLPDPLGNPIPNATIRFTAIATEGQMPKGLDAEAITDGNGAYDFDLENGRYRVEVNFFDEFHDAAEISMTDVSEDGDLLHVIKTNLSIDPPLLIPGPVSWETLFSEAMSQDTWNRQSEFQVRQEDTFVNERRDVYHDDDPVNDKYLAKEILSLQSDDGGSTAAKEAKVYSDQANNLAATDAEGLTVGGIEVTDTKEAYQASDGVEEATTTSKVTGSNGTATDTTHLDDDKLTHTKILENSVASTTETSSVEADHIEGVPNAKPRAKKVDGVDYDEPGHTGNVSTTKDVRFIDAEGLVEALLESGATVYNTEAFERLLVKNSGSVSTLQADSRIIQDSEGVPVVTVDTQAKEVTLDARLTVNNPEDFTGEEGWSYDHELEYSQDQGATDPWHETYNPAHPDIYRRERKFRFKDSDPVGTKQVIGTWEVHQLNAVDGIAGDNFFLEYQYSTNDTTYGLDQWHNTYVVGDDWRRFRSVSIDHQNNYSYSAWTDERMKGTDGSNGSIVIVEYEYSVDGLTPWHTNLTNGDHYRRERLAYFVDETQVDADNPFQVTPWSAAGKIVPEEGVDYGYKHAAVYLYQRSVSAPTGPATDLTYNFLTLTVTGTLGNWSNTIPAGTDPIWVSVATAYSLAEEDTIPPGEWVVEQLAQDGADGTQTAFAPLYQLSPTEPAVPGVALTYTFATGVVSGTLGSWTNTPPNAVGEGDRVWVTFNTAFTSVANTTDALDSGNWSTPVVWKQNGTNGTDGNPGTDGNHGQGSFRKYATSIPIDSVKDTDVAAIANRDAQEGDLLNYYKDDGAAATQFSRFWFRGVTTWTEVANLVNGDSVIDGTLAAIKLQAATITGDKISSTTTVIAGSGTASAGMNGYDDGSGIGVDKVRFFSGIGQALAYTAPFRVMDDGYLYATNAYIQGTIDGSTINGSTINGGTIVGATIVVDNTFVYKCDPLKDGTTYYYIDYPTTPLYCNPVITYAASQAVGIGDGEAFWTDFPNGSVVLGIPFNIKSAGNRYGAVDLNRARYPVLPAGAFHGAIYCDGAVGLPFSVPVRLKFVNALTQVVEYVDGPHKLHLGNAAGPEDFTLTLHGLSLRFTQPDLDNATVDFVNLQSNFGVTETEGTFSLEITHDYLSWQGQNAVDLVMEVNIDLDNEAVPL